MLKVLSLVVTTLNHALEWVTKFEKVTCNAIESAVADLVNLPYWIAKKFVCFVPSAVIQCARELCADAVRHIFQVNKKTC